MGVLIVVVSSQPAAKKHHAKKHVAKKHVAKAAKPKDTKKAKEIAKYKKLKDENAKKWGELGLKQWKIDIENQQKYLEFSQKWLAPAKGKDAKKWMKNKAAALKKLKLGEMKRWNDLKKEELKLATDQQKIDASLKKLGVKSNQDSSNGDMKENDVEEIEDEDEEEVNDEEEMSDPKKAAKKAHKKAAKKVKVTKVHHKKKQWPSYNRMNNHGYNGMNRGNNMRGNSRSNYGGEHERVSYRGGWSNGGGGGGNSYHGSGYNYNGGYGGGYDGQYDELELQFE